MRDIAGPFEVDGRWFCDKGNARVDSSDNNVLEAYGTDGVEDCLVRRGFRGDKYVATFKFKWNDSTSPGCLVRWLSPGDYLAIAVSASDEKARLYKRESDGALSTLKTASTALTLTSGSWYDALVVIDDDPNDANLQQLRFWVDSNQNGFGDDTCLITSTAVDDVWSAGYVGLYRGAGGSAIQQYDDVKIGYDNNGDGDILDAGDDIQILDNFSSNVMSLSYDNNGNLTDDGVLRYVYDGWNRLKNAQRYADGDTTTTATYSYLPDHRRSSKVVEHCGIEAVANDGGDTTVHFYYSHQWRIVETRNGSNQATRQWVWGTQYVDEILFMDVNGSPATHNDCDPDTTPEGDGQDRRYLYHQDRNWNVIALTEYDDGVGVNGRTAERYAYTPYGEFAVLKGDGGSGELGRTLVTSSGGSPFAHQGLAFDQEKNSYQNRHREYTARGQRFAQRDPLGYQTAHPVPSLQDHDGASAYLYVVADPLLAQDPSGAACRVRWRRNAIKGTGRAKFHAGIEVDTNSDGNPDGHNDYGWSGSTWFDCCSENVKWDQYPQVRAPDSIDPPDPSGGDVGPWHDKPDSVCGCLANQPTNFNRYCLLGVPLDPCCSNSNGAINQVRQNCGVPPPPPVWGGGPFGYDGTLPGWDNTPNTDPLCNCPPGTKDTGDPHQESEYGNY